MADDSVSIDPQQAADGLAVWDTAHGTLNSAVTDALSRIRALEQSRPWGADSAGSEFAAAYSEPSGLVGDGAGAVTTALGDLGVGARTAIEQSLVSDAVQAAPVSSSTDSL